MIEGLLWFDDSKVRSLADKIGLAVTRYEKKHGHKPNVCYVHPTEMGSHVEMTTDSGVKVLAVKSVLPNHLWLGVMEKSKR
jgi:hypothetical protein